MDICSFNSLRNIMALHLLSISFQYPAWYFIFCLAIATLGSIILYYGFDQFPGQPEWLRKVLFALRFLTLLILSILLLSPILKSKNTEVKKPVIVIAQDVSESISIDQSKEKLEKYSQDLQKLASSFGNDYDVKTYSFGENIREGFDSKFADKSTNISDLLTDVSDIYNNQNLGAIVLATDGVFNQGSDPAYTAAKVVVPVYPVTLGDTIPKKDLYIKKIFHNNIAYLKDKFTIQIDIAARNCQGKTTQWQISRVEGKADNVLQRGSVSIDGKDFFKSMDLVLDADKSGVQHYRLTLSKVDGEITTVNNTKDIYVDIIDARLKILILANGPHPDISAIKQVVSNNQNYVVESALIADLKVKPTDYDFVILHQLPAKNTDISNVLQQLDTKKIPRLFILGSQSDLYKFNKVQSLISINGDGRNLNEAQASFAAGFSLFTIDPNLSQNVGQFPPLTTLFGEYKITGNAKVLLNQKIGKVETSYPLLLFGEFNGIKTGILCGEGIWRWRFFDFLQRKNQENIDQLIDKTIQYLSVKEDKRKFRVVLPKNVFLENEQITFDAELYNNSYELINEGDVNMVIKNENGKEFPYTFSKTGHYYTLNGGYYPPGTYSFVAKTLSGGKTESFTGKFEVQAVQLELFETTANHGILKLLAQSTGGTVVYQDQLSSLKEIISKSDKIKPVLYQTNLTRPIINLKSLFFLLLTLLSLEWFMRRYFGSY
jgi:hypothetical protein